MKNQIAQHDKSQAVKNSHMKPENKDNLDSRKNEEWDNKGDDVTNNKKETKEGKKKSH